MPVTLRDIAKQLNLSHATVSIVLNERHDISIPDATRQRVFEAARQMGYRPNRVARALVSGRTQMVAISVPALRHPYYVSVFQRLFDMALQRGYGVLVHQSTRGPARRAFDWPVDGVLISDAPEVTRRDELPPDLPVVSMGAFVDTNIDHVQIDFRRGAQIAIERLAAIGCKKIVHVRSGSNLDRYDERQAGYNDLLKRLGIRHSVLEVPAGALGEVRDCVRTSVRKAGPPDAFFCTNDQFATAVLRGMADEGYFAPKDFLIIGFDGSDAGEMSVPALSTVCEPIQEMCEIAFEFLARRMKDGKQPVQGSVLESRFEERESSTRP